MKIQFAAHQSMEIEIGSAIAAIVFEGRFLSPDAEALDRASAGAVSRAIAGGRFTGKLGQTCELIACHGLHAARLLLVGVGQRHGLTSLIAEEAGGNAYAALKLSGVRTLGWSVAGLTPLLAAHVAFGSLLASYCFDRYLTQQEPAERPSIEVIRVFNGDTDAVVRAFAPLSALGQGIGFARDLVSEPANILHPEAFAARAKTLECFGLAVTVLGEAELRALGMGALLGVGQGSRRESQLVVLKWFGASDPNAAPIAFVGKGVTFDSGGISTKEAANMEEMKTDMAGAATVTGLMLTLASRKARVNAVGILGLVENMPDGNAQRPGDIVTSMSGQTIELINTDAEGRLVLADALWYAQQKFKPKAIVDLATLTGAVIVALGDDYAGVMSNDDRLVTWLMGAGTLEGEHLWRLPLPAQYDKLHDTPVADMKNVGGHPAAGAITAALFLQRFIRCTPWAHIDIAGVVWKKKSSSTVTPDGATGYGVRLLNRWVADYHDEH